MGRPASLRLPAFCLLVVVVEGLATGQTGTFAPSRPSVVNVGALFTYDSIIGRAAQLAIKLAVEDVNANPNFLAGTTLNVITQDTNCSGFLGTIEGK